MVLIALDGGLNSAKSSSGSCCRRDTQNIGLQRMKRSWRWEKTKIQLGRKEFEEGKRVKAMRNWGIWAIEFLGRKEASTRFDTAQTKHRQSGGQWDTSSGFPYELICCGMELVRLGSLSFTSYEEGKEQRDP